MVALICMLAQVYALPITQQLIFSFHFINFLSYYHCLRYLVFHVLFSSIDMAVIYYKCITSASDISKSIIYYMN